MRDHHDHRAGHADEVQARDAEEDEAHVRDGRVADELVQVALTHGDPAAIQNVAEAKEREDVQPLLRALGHQRQRDAEETVETELLQHSRVKHRRGGRSRAIAERRPGVKRPERNENAEAKHQQREDEVLRVRGHRVRAEVFGERDDVEGALRHRHLEIETDQANQRDERSGAEIDRDVVGRVVLVLSPAPHANHDEGRDERELMERVEEEEVERRECAEDAAGHHHEQQVIELLVRFDFPRHARRRERYDGAHEDQPDVDAIHTDEIVDAERFDPRNALDELVAADASLSGFVAKKHLRRDQQ